LFIHHSHFIDGVKPARSALDNEFKKLNKRMSEIILHPSDDGVAERQRTEIHVYLFKSREAKTLAQIAKAIQLSEKQIEYHLNVLIGEGRVYYIPTGGGRWGIP
jgi:Bacterial regulatory protein, arsR family